MIDGEPWAACHQLGLCRVWGQSNSDQPREQLHPTPTGMMPSKPHEAKARGDLFAGVLSCVTVEICELSV